MTDRELIDRAGRGDPAAVRALYDRHAERVWAVVRRLAGDEARAEDWAQEAWIRILRGLSGFRGEAKLSTWIHTVAVRTALDGRRRRGRRADDEPLGEESPATGAESTAVERVALERAIDRLPDGMRRVLVLHDIEGYTHVEIGEALGVAPGTSRSQLFKARTKLREWIAPRGSGRANDRRRSCPT